MAEKAILDDLKRLLDKLSISGHIDLVNFKNHGEIMTRWCGAASLPPAASVKSLGPTEIISNDICTYQLLDINKHCQNQDLAVTRPIEQSAAPPRTRGIKPSAEAPRTRLGGDAIGRSEETLAITYAADKPKKTRAPRDGEELPGGGSKSRTTSAESGRSNWQNGEPRTSAAELRKLRTQVERLQDADHRARLAEEELHAMRSEHTEQAQVVRGVVGAWRRFGGCVQGACQVGDVGQVDGSNRRQIQPLSEHPSDAPMTLGVTSKV